MTSPSSSAPAAGRPRSEEAHKAILDATLELYSSEYQIDFSGGIFRITTWP